MPKCFENGICPEKGNTNITTFATKNIKTVIRWILLFFPFVVHRRENCLK